LSLQRLQPSAYRTAFLAISRRETVFGPELDKDYGPGSTRDFEGAQQVKTQKTYLVRSGGRRLFGHTRQGWVPLHRLQNWDSALDGALLCKTGSSLGATLAVIHASRKEGGLGVFSFTALALQCGATELLVGLNGAGIGGKVARCRYKAALAAYP
jgi:hypothetical protein